VDLEGQTVEDSLLAPGCERHRSEVATLVSLYRVTYVHLPLIKYKPADTS
jgi:hypothetical protein